MSSTPKTKVRATARVQLTIEISGEGGVWGADCSIDQVHRQAREGAIGALHRVINRAARLDAEQVPAVPINLRIVGEPKVTAVLVEEEDR
jgi:hypothetical protein